MDFWVVRCCPVELVERLERVWSAYLTVLVHMYLDYRTLQ